MSLVRLQQAVFASQLNQGAQDFESITPGTVSELYGEDNLGHMRISGAYFVDAVYHYAGDDFEAYALGIVGSAYLTLSMNSGHNVRIVDGYFDPAEANFTGDDFEDYTLGAIFWFTEPRTHPFDSGNVRFTDGLSDGHVIDVAVTNNAAGDDFEDYNTGNITNLKLFRNTGTVKLREGIFH